MTEPPKFFDFLSVTDAMRLAAGGGMSAVLTLSDVSTVVGIVVGLMTIVYLGCCIRIRWRQIRRGIADDKEGKG